MSLFFTYLLQVNIALVLFYLLYAVLLKRDTFWGLRRFFFLSVIIFSLLYPLCAIPALGDLWSFGSSDFQEAGTTVFIGEPKMTVMGEEVVVPASIPWKEIFFLLYIAVTSIFVLRFLLQLLSIYRVRMKSERQIISGVPVYQLKEDITPFSFFGMIFIHTDKHSENELSQILLHEQTHARQWHSIDIMFIELLCLFSWWNPFVWLMKREMAMNLEYLADSGVLREGVDSREYQYHLLRLTYQETAVQIVNKFNVSQLKQRIMMMNKAKSPTLKLAKYLLVLPLFFLFIAVNSIYATQNEDKSIAVQSADESLQELSQPWTEDNNLPEPPPEKKKEEMYQVVDTQPEFPGGIEGLTQFFSDNIRYPKEAHEKKIEGRVICRFAVMNDGSIDSVKILRGVEASLDEEAIRVVYSMPKWKPGKQNGEAVNVWFTLPVVFRLNNPEPEETEKEVVEITVENVETAQFPGGERAYRRYLADNVRYPVIAQENGIQGHVSAVFNVDSKGKITFVRFEKSVDPSLDAEVKRVIENMPDWTPAKRESGEPTGMTTGVDFVFRLQGDEVKSYAGSIPENAMVVVGYGVQKASE